MSAPPLRTLIVDDEAVARARLRALCADVGGAVEVIGEAADGRQALALIGVGGTDLVLLDIAMPDLDGLAVAAALARSATPPVVVFCTAHPVHALTAFEVGAADYLLKPVSRERLGEAVARAVRLRGDVAALRPAPPGRLDHLWAPHRHTMIRIDIRAVERIEAEGDYVRLVTPQGAHLLHETMTRLEERLDPDLFVRVRRSTIVRADLIVAATHLGGGAWTVTLADGAAVRVGPTYWKTLKDRLKPDPAKEGTEAVGPQARREVAC